MLVPAAASRPPGLSRALYRPLRRDNWMPSSSVRGITTSDFFQKSFPV
jgi:hypothetical protein